MKAENHFLRAWSLLTGEDFNYPDTTGDRPQKTWAEKQIGAYLADLLELAPHDAAVFSALMPVRIEQPNIGLLRQHGLQCMALEEGTLQSCLP